jgi:hypothetical protein
MCGTTSSESVSNGSCGLLHRSSSPKVRALLSYFCPPGAVTPGC